MVLAKWLHLLAAAQFERLIIHYEHKGVLQPMCKYIPMKVEMKIIKINKINKN